MVADRKFRSNDTCEYTSSPCLIDISFRVCFSEQNSELNSDEVRSWTPLRCWDLGENLIRVTSDVETRIILIKALANRGREDREAFSDGMTLNQVSPSSFSCEEIR
jgi:hypothetical protein